MIKNNIIKSLIIGIIVIISSLVMCNKSNAVTIKNEQVNQIKEIIETQTDLDLEEVTF